MPEYLYKATTISGQTVEGSISGKDEETAIQNLHRLGYIPIRLTTVQPKKAPFRFSSYLPHRVDVKSLLVFTQEISTLISAGVPIDRSLEILRELTENQKMKEVIKDVLKRVEGGSSLAEAFLNHPKIFSKLYVNMVKAGESGGFLGLILSRLVQYLQSIKEVRDQIVSVLIYPIILSVVSGVSIAILVTFVIPRFAKIFSDMGQAIPLPTQIILSFSQFVRGYWWVGIGLLALLYSGIKWYTRDEERKWRWDLFKLKLLTIGDLIQKVELSRFARTLGTLLQSGVPVLAALNLVREISQNQAISRSIGYVHDRLREGKGISRSLEETGVFPPLAVYMIGVGEETGSLDEMLIKVAETYEENVRIMVKRLVSLVEPIILLVMGGIVGFIVLSILLAISSITEIPV